VTNYKWVFLLIVIMMSVAGAIGMGAVSILYHTAFEEERQRLAEITQSQARLMEAVARFNQTHSRNHLEGSRAATLSQIKGAHEHYKGFGETGELMMAERQDDNIVFLWKHRHVKSDTPTLVPFHSSLAEPMRRALSGQSGTLVTLDIRGIKVLAAYEPVAILNLGIVAKLDLAEIRAPFLKAGSIVGGAALVLIAVGTFLFFRVSNPMIRRISVSEERFRSISTLAQDAIIMTDSEDKVSFWNKGAQRTFGYRSGEATGRVLVDLISPKGYREHHKACIDSFRRTGRGPLMNTLVELEAVRKDGTAFPVEVSVSSVQLGGKWNAVWMIRDITERKEKDAQLLQAQKMELVGQLTGGFAHDCNNLLTIILGNLQLLEEEMGSKQELRELVADALSAARDGAELTQRLLTFSRRRILQPQRADINACLDGFARLLRRTLGEVIELEIKQDNTIPAIFVDLAQFESALLNLAINARDAMPTGGTLSIETSNTRIDPGEAPQSLLALRPGTYVKISVCDTGIGMSPENVAHAVEPFYTTKTNAKGSGLGLSMVYGFAKESGGEFLLRSALGKGTTASLFLPTLSSTGEQSPVQATPRGLPRGTETILVVEDEPRVRHLAQRSLMDLGYRVLETENASAAMEVLETEPGVDLVFSDIVMPGGIDGYELARWVVKNRPKLNVLLTSGFKKQLANEHVTDKGGFPLLQKPYTKEQLAKAVRAALSNA
jgi:PAS domain S-box-containing protein